MDALYQLSYIGNIVGEESANFSRRDTRIACIPPSQTASGQFSSGHIIPKKHLKSN
jgi:hypothetical protein